jgi:Fe2+ or Zn2+ uptake regulation protein
VPVQTSHLDDLAGDRPSDRTVLDIVRTSAGEDGLTAATIVQLAEERNVKRSTVYQAVKSLVARGVLRNIGSDKRARYIPTAVAQVLEEQP